VVAEAGLGGDGRHHAGLDQVDEVLLDDLGGVVELPARDAQGGVDQGLAGGGFGRQQGNLLLSGA